MANVGYYHARNLQKNGVDVELVMRKDPPPSSDPFKRDPNLKNNPDWIRFYDPAKIIPLHFIF